MSDTQSAGAGNIPNISFIVPCYNEEGNVARLANEIARTFCTRGISSEIILVDDGSSDGTLDACKALIAADHLQVEDLTAPLTIKALGFSRNFGKESALYAGLQEATGNTLCFIDADLQQDPQVAYDMYDYLVSHDDCDVVAAYQDQRKENKVVAWLKGRFYAVFNATSDEIELPADMSDFRVFTRQVAEALLSMPEHHRFTKGLFAWVGFKTHAVPYVVNERYDGTSSWSTKSLFRYAYAGITSFSTWPLKVLKFLGGIVSVLATLYLLYVLIFDYIIFGIGIPGYPTLVCLILLFGGLQLAAIGVLGDYLARSYIEGKNRPLYIVRDRQEKTFETKAE